MLRSKEMRSIEFAGAYLRLGEGGVNDIHPHGIPPRSAGD
jgi:hypothetical protein